MSLHLTCWNGIGTVTGANFLLEDHDTRILVDCGLLQGVANATETNKLRFPYDPSKIHFLFITHAHMDHIGRIPKLVKDGFRGVIYSTAQTKELAGLMLADALKIMDMNKKELNEAPMYELADLEQTLSLWQTISYDKETKLNDQFSVLTKDAGHILGSAMYQFNYLNAEVQKKLGRPMKILFTGDSGNSPSPLF